MRQFVRSIARKNRHLERVLRLGVKTARTLRSRGLRTTARIVAQKIRHKRNALQLQRHRVKIGLPQGWPEYQIPSPSDLLEQRKWSAAEGYRPTISLIVPLSGHSEEELRATVNSLTTQSYPNWTLALIGEPREGSRIAKELSKLERSDPRIHRVSPRSGQLPLESLNQALDAAKGEYCGVIPVGDRLSIDALYQVAKALTLAPETDVIYTDEAHVSPGSRKLGAVLLKPDWSPELLLGYNYLGSLSVIRRTHLKQVGGYDAAYRQAQEWDLLLRLMEADCHVKRVPHCCYVRQTESKFVPAGAETGTHYRKALEAYVQRQNLPAKVEPQENGVFRLRWSLPVSPLVSIVIPNKNNVDLLRALVEGLHAKTDYPHKEILVVDNQSTDPELDEYYRQQTKAGRIRVVPFDREFNYSAACNAGAQAARGEFLLFLNNDMEVISSDWLDELVGWASQPNIGVVGTKLLYPEGAIQHCGIVVGLHFVTHVRHRVPEVEWGVFGTADSYRNFLAVTGACQMVSRRVFEEIGGFDEEYVLVGSDVAMCLRARNKGYRTVYTPFASLIHYEEYTRRKFTPLEDMERLAREIRDLKLLEDPYLNPSLNALAFDPELRGGDDPSPKAMLAQQLNSYDPPEDHFAMLDWFDDEAIASQTKDWNVAFRLPAYSPAKTPHNLADAKQLILHVLRNHPDIRERFPLALSSGVEGEFCRWLCEEGIHRFRIPVSAAGKIREVFESKPGLRIRQLYSISPELRREFPAAFLPMGQKHFLRWLLQLGRPDSPDQQFHDEDIWWLCLEAAEDPAREFEFTYRISQEWQENFPAGLTAFGSEKLRNWLQTRHRFSESLLEALKPRTHHAALEDVRFAYWNKADWRASFPRAFRDAAETRNLLTWLRPQTGMALTVDSQEIEAVCKKPLAINVLAHFCYPSGLQQSARSIARSYELENVSVALRDVPAHYWMDDPNRGEFLDLETHDVSLIHVQPLPDVEQPYLDRVYHLAGLALRSDVYRIGYWYWELEEAPTTWKMPPMPFKSYGLPRNSSPTPCEIRFPSE